jgi:hypothetical protein
MDFIKGAVKQVTGVVTGQVAQMQEMLPLPPPVVIPPYQPLEPATPGMGGTTLEIDIPYSNSLLIMATGFTCAAVYFFLDLVVFQLWYRDNGFGIIASVVIAGIWFGLALAMFVKNRRTLLTFDFASQEVHVNELRMIPECFSCCCCENLEFTLAFADVAGAIVAQDETCCGCCASYDIMCTPRNGRKFRLGKVAHGDRGTNGAAANWIAFLHILPQVQRGQVIGPLRPQNLRAAGTSAEIADAPYMMVYTVFAAICVAFIIDDVFNFLLSFLFGRPEFIRLIIGLVIGGICLSIFLFLNRRNRVVINYQRRTVEVSEWKPFPGGCQDSVKDIDFGEFIGCPAYAQARCCCCCSGYDIVVRTKSSGNVRLGWSASHMQVDAAVNTWNMHLAGLAGAGIALPAGLHMTV